MQIISRSFLFLTWAVVAAIVAIIALMILRLIVNAADLNPFGWPARTIRRLTDPFVMPVRRALLGFGVDPKFAPLVIILITILLGWFFLWLSEEVARTIAGLVIAIRFADPVMGLGWVIYGA